jgi:hypothetical protein
MFIPAIAPTTQLPAGIVGLVMEAVFPVPVAVLETPHAVAPFRIIELPR